MVKEQFPILSKEVNNKPLIYLDNASTTQKPASVIDEIQEYYECTNSNIHRGVHHLSQKATEEYEEARKKIQTFIGAKSSKEIVFVRGATEAVNLVANSYVNPLLSEGDNIIISHMEHHANIVPWQLIAKQKNIDIKVIHFMSKHLDYVEQADGTFKWQLAEIPAIKSTPTETKTVKKEINDIPDLIKRNNRRDLIENGLKAECVIEGLKQSKILMDSLEENFKNSDWFTGSKFGLADAAVFPYVLRWEQLYLMNYCSESTHPHINNWFNKIKKLPFYEKQITSYLPMPLIDALKQFSLNQKEELDSLFKSCLLYTSDAADE